VLDVNRKAHEVDNLYVTDTSFFPSIGAVNPALTAIAKELEETWQQRKWTRW
jgi:choline dehydrogenase-like flavoprotein